MNNRKTTQGIQRKLSATEKEVVNFFVVHKLIKDKVLLNPGDKAKLNIDMINSDVNYTKMRPEYKNWIENHKNQIMTIDEFEKGFSHHLVCFKEDETIPKWLFWEGVLIPQKSLTK